MIGKKDYLRILPYLLTYMSSKMKSYKPFLTSKGCLDDYKQQQLRVNKFIQYLVEKKYLHEAYSSMTVGQIKKDCNIDALADAIRLIADDDVEFSTIVFSNMFVNKEGMTKDEIIAGLCNEQELDFLVAYQQADLKDAVEVDKADEKDQDETDEIPTKNNISFIYNTTYVSKRVEFFGNKASIPIRDKVIRIIVEDNPEYLEQKKQALLEKLSAMSLDELEKIVK